MSIPKVPTADCIIHINMGGPTLPKIIQQMTGVEIRVLEGKRQVLLPNGATVTPIPAVRINGLNDANLDRLFSNKPDIAVALRTSNLYKRKMAGGCVSESCVSFLVPVNENSDVVMDLTVNRELGEKIAVRLFTHG